MAECRGDVCILGKVPHPGLRLGLRAEVGDFHVREPDP